MQVDESTLKSILEGSKQYVIPLYQRPYAWRKENWQKIWEDLGQLVISRRNHPNDSHFTGTLVLDTGIVTPEITQFLVVDGQQRLTTLSILLAAISNFYDANGDKQAAKRIREQVLVNTFANENNTYRLRPANFDEVTYRSAVNGDLVHTSNSKIDDAYLYFYKKLQSLSKEGITIQELESTILVGLKFVTITTKAEDNVYRIFESINNTGIDLTQADLIRNLVFMRLGEQSELLYSKYWLPLQKDIESRDLETVFWIESLWRSPEVRLQDTYTFQKSLISNLTGEELANYLENTKLIGDSLKELIHRETREKSPFSQTLETLRRLDIPGAQVLIVRLLYLRKLNVIQDDETQRALNIVLGYLIRRAIAAVPVNTVGGISNAAAFNLRENAAESLHKYLSTGKKKYVTNEEIKRIFLEEPVYKRRKMRLILELLLQAQQNAEEVNWDPMTIEHVLPQSPSEDGWEEFRESCSGEDAENAFESLVDTIGNLTLTVYNSALSNSSFKTKRGSWLTDTGVTSTQLIAKKEAWGPTEIRERSYLLATKAMEMWPGPDESLLEKEPKAIGERIDEVVRSIPAGSWTSYGDIAEVVGTASMVVGNRISGEPTLGAWRVMRSNGRVSRHFRWNEDSEYKDMSPVEVLEREGLEFTKDGLASPESRLDADALRDRLGEDS